MGMLEQELNDSSVNYIVRRLNGFRAAQKQDRIFELTMFREVCFYAGNGGNFTKGVSRDRLFEIPGEKEAIRKANKKRIKELQEGIEVMRRWPKPKGIA